jgi:hypothetical protein
MGYNNPFEPPVTRFGAACVVVQEYNLPGSGMVTCTVSLQIVPVSEFVVAGGAGGGAGVFLPGAGAVVVKAAGGLPEADVARGGRKGKPPFAPLYRKVTGAGWLAFRLKLSPSTKAALRRRHKLTLPIVLTFTPRGGKPVVRRQRLTLTLPPCTRITIPKRTHGHRPQHPVLPAPHSCMPRL